MDIRTVDDTTETNAASDKTTHMLPHILLK